MNIWHEFNDERIKENDFIAVIEISKGMKQKYELDKETGMIILDRVLHTSTQYPANYGFIPKTYSDDGDPLDVLVLASESLVPLSLVRCYPIGVVTMIDKGKLDDKIIAIPYGDPMYNEYNTIDELPKHIANELIHFLKIYKELENKITEVRNLEGKEAALKAITQAIKLYKETFGEK